MRGKGKSGATTAAKENAVNTVAKKAESTIEAVAEKTKVSKYEKKQKRYQQKQLSDANDAKEKELLFTIAKAKLRILSPPSTKIHNNTINVLNEVLMVRAKVVFNESLNNCIRLRFGYRPKNSRIRSKITTLSLIE